MTGSDIAFGLISVTVAAGVIMFSLRIRQIWALYKSEKRYTSHIDKPEQHTTSRGGSYIKPFDLIRSKRGRDLVDHHARINK